MKRRPSSLAGLLFVLLAVPPDSGVAGILITQFPPGAAREVETAGGGLPAGSRIVLFDPSRPPESARSLTQGFAAAGRASLSADASRFLFVGRKRAADRLTIWEMELGSGTARQVAGCAGDCTRAIYASSLFHIQAAGPVPQIVYSAVERGGRSTLYAMDEDGSRPRRIAFDPAGAGDPLLLSDGRLLYSAGIDGGKGAALQTIHTDGTGVVRFAAGSPSARQGQACETRDGEVLFVESDPEDPLGGGALVAVPRTRSLTERRAASAARGRFRSPSPLPDWGVLAAFEPDGHGSYGIYRLDPRGDDPPELVFDTPDRHEIDPVAVVPRPVPNGRSSAVRDGLAYGTLYCIDSRRPAGGTSIATVASIDVYRASDDLRDAHGTRIGTVPIEPDGSFFIRIPAKTPLRLETVNAEGTTLRAMRNWFWVMPNESRGCVGCHENGDLAPPNRMPLALRRPPVEVGVSLTGGSGKTP